LKRVVQHKPVAYQDIDGVHRTVGWSYCAASRRGFRGRALRWGASDRHRSDTRYSTNLAAGLPGKGIAVDGSGNVDVTGKTISSPFLTTPAPYQVTVGRGPAPRKSVISACTIWSSGSLTSTLSRSRSCASDASNRGRTGLSFLRSWCGPRQKGFGRTADSTSYHDHPAFLKRRFCT